MRNCGSHGFLWIGTFNKNIFPLFPQIFGCFESRGDLDVLKHNHYTFSQPSSWFPAQFAPYFIHPSLHGCLIQTEGQDLWTNPLLSPQMYCFEVLFSFSSMLNFHIHLSLFNLEHYFSSEHFFLNCLRQLIEDHLMKTLSLIRMPG